MLSLLPALPALPPDPLLLVGLLPFSPAAAASAPRAMLLPPLLAMEASTAACCCAKVEAAPVPRPSMGEGLSTGLEPVLFPADTSEPLDRDMPPGDALLLPAGEGLLLTLVSQPEALAAANCRSASALARSEAASCARSASAAASASRQRWYDSDSLHRLLQLSKIMDRIK